jgi:hypothetical protein
MPIFRRSYCIHAAYGNRRCLGAVVVAHWYTELQFSLNLCTDRPPRPLLVTVTIGCMYRIWPPEYGHLLLETCRGIVIFYEKMIICASSFYLMHSQNINVFSLRRLQTASCVSQIRSGMTYFGLWVGWRSNMGSIYIRDKIRYKSRRTPENHCTS